MIFDKKREAYASLFYCLYLPLDPYFFTKTLWFSGQKLVQQAFRTDTAKPIAGPDYSYKSHPPFFAYLCKLFENFYLYRYDRRSDKPERRNPK